MKQLNKPNVAIPLTPEDEARVDKVLQPKRTHIKSSPFEGKSLYQQYGKSLPINSKGLAGWCKFLGSMKAAPETTYSRLGMRAPKLTQLGGPLGTRPSSKPSQLSQSEELPEIIPPEVEDESTFSRTGQKPVRETQVANNIPYGIPGQRVAIQKPQSKLGALPPISRKVTQVNQQAQKERLAEEVEVMKKRKQEVKPKEKDKILLGEEFPSAERMIDEWGSDMFRMAKRYLNNDVDAENAVQEALLKHFNWRAKHKDDPNYRKYDAREFKTTFFDSLKKIALDIGRRKSTKSRNTNREEGPISNDEDPIEHVDPITLPPDKEMDNDEIKQTVFNAIEKLSYLEKIVVMLHYYGLFDPEREGIKRRQFEKERDEREKKTGREEKKKKEKKFELSYEQIVEELKKLGVLTKASTPITVENVKQLLYKGNQQLAIILGKEFAESTLAK